MYIHGSYHVYVPLKNKLKTVQKFEIMAKNRIPKVYKNSKRHTEIKHKQCFTQSWSFLAAV